jgi:S-formylglutathione hydrolase
MMSKRPVRSLLLICSLAVSLLAGCYTDQLPELDHPRLAPGVAMQDVTFFSAALNRQMSYRVFLPARLLAGEKLPVVYLLHGSGGSYRNWSNYSDVAHYAGPGGSSAGLVLVMPEGDSSYYMNAVGKPEDKYGDYLTHDLIVDVEARFPAAQDRASRAVVGVSMGGFAAVKLALSRPELFFFAGAISPAIDVPSRRFSLRRWGQGVRFRSIFGPEGSESRKKSDPFVLVRSADPARTPYLFLTAGEQEALLEPNRRFASRLQQGHFAYEFHTKPGGHDWTEWDSQIPGCFESLLKKLSVSKYPTLSQSARKGGGTERGERGRGKTAILPQARREGRRPLEPRRTCSC